MATLRIPAGRRVDGAKADKEAQAVAPRDVARDAPGLLDDELLDLYGAILIVVPVALLMKSLWF